MMPWPSLLLTTILSTGHNMIWPLVVAFSTLATSSPSPLVPLHYVRADSGKTADGGDNGECRLLGPFSLVVQAALGTLALLSLVYKRWKERPQRPIKVWAFDVSKQVFGSAMLHLANLLMSMFSAGSFEITSEYTPNPCSFYLLNLGIDTTLGIPILILILRILNILALYTPLANPPESMESGNYGQPPRAMWWFKQSIVYFLGLLSMKICVFFIIQLLPFIVKIGDWALRWTEGNTAVQIFFVMLLFPVIMNAIQYYIIDIFIKKPLSPSHELLTAEDDVDDSDDDFLRDNELLPEAEVDEASETEGDTLNKGDGEGLEHVAQTEVAVDPNKPGQDGVAIDAADTSTESSVLASSSSSDGEYGYETQSSTKLTIQSKDSP